MMRRKKVNHLRKKSVVRENLGFSCADESSREKHERDSVSHRMNCLARSCAALDPEEEQMLAEESMVWELEVWPEY